MGGRGKVGQRHLLELNVISLSDWPIAYRCITFQYDERANRLKVEGELLPHRGTPPRNDTELLAVWEALTCAESGVASDRLRAEDLAVVKEQKASRGTLVEWLYEGLGESCKPCLKKLYEHAQRYQDEMLEVIDQAYLDLGEEAHSRLQRDLPAFCAGRDLPHCISALRSAAPGDLHSSIVLFQKKAQLVAEAGTRLDDLRSPRAKAYMTCRAVLAAKDDFDLTPDNRNVHRGEEYRRKEDFFRIEATVGMD